MKDKKEYIQKKAFDVFMNKGYDSVSIIVLQKELGMLRGAICQYFKWKDELFKLTHDNLLSRPKKS